MPGGVKISMLRLTRGDLDFDFLVVELPSRSILRNFCRVAPSSRLAARLIEADAARRRQQRIEDAFLGVVLGAHLHLPRFPLAQLLDRGFHQVADDGVHVACPT